MDDFTSSPIGRPRYPIQRRDESDESNGRTGDRPPWGATLRRVTSEVGSQGFIQHHVIWGQLGVTKGKTSNNFSITTLIKSRFLHKVGYLDSSKFCGSRFLINWALEELFKKLCLSIWYLIICVADLLEILRSDSMGLAGIIIWPYEWQKRYLYNMELNLETSSAHSHKQNTITTTPFSSTVTFPSNNTWLAATDDTRLC
jgi:hypothetical protein